MTSGSKILSVLKQSAVSKSAMSEVLKSYTQFIYILKSNLKIKSLKEDIPVECINTCIKQLIDGFDSKFGGFSSAPKFPQPVNFNLLFLIYARDSKSIIGQECLKLCTHTLTKMANGGIHDHVGQVNKY